MPKSSSKIAVLVPVAAVFLTAAYLAGCATEVAHHTFLGKPLPSHPATHPVDVYTNSLPTRRFTRIAILDVHCESQGFMQPNLQKDGLPRLIAEARKAGCDAIIEIQSRVPKNWSFETKTIHYTATGIAYQ